jgi:hypothetical protein
MEIDIGAKHHAGKRLVDAIDEVLVVGAVFKPDGVKVDGFGKGTEERKNVDDLRGVRRHHRLVNARGEFRRRQKVEGERYVLGEIEGGIGQGVLANVLADGVTCITRGGRAGKGVVELLADGEANRGRVVEVGIVAAGVESCGYVEEGLAGFERDS